MPNVDINGSVVAFPDTLSPEELQAAVSKAAGQLQPQKSLLRKGLDALSVPEQKSREGLEMIAKSIPESVGGPMTGNLALDLAKGAPRVAAETLAETAPSFVSKGAILTAGASKIAQGAAPMVKAVAKGLGRQGESLVGAAPGALEAAYKDSSLIGAKGKKAVEGLYQEAKALGGGIRKELRNTKDATDFVKKAVDLADDGSLTPTEALEARKELGKIKKRVTDVFFRDSREKLDAIAKQVFSGADKEFQRAVQAESLRNLFPQNKYGGASAFKLGIMTALQNMGAPGKIAGLFMSPAAAGVTATGAGIAGRNVVSPLVNNPRAAAGAAAALDRLAKSRKRDRR